MITMVNVASIQKLSTNDATLWRSYLPTRRSVFGSVEFASIAEQYVGFKGTLFVFSKGEEVIVYPLLLRPISELPFDTNGQSKGWDTLSPDYTGPLAQGLVTAATANSFRNCFTKYCQQEQIITEFAHLHPWHWSANLLASEDVCLNREIVYVDLTLSEEQLWRDSFTKACRKNIKRAHRENVRVFQAETASDIKEFYRIYVGTMDRRQALTRYYFSLDYFVAFFERMSDNARFMLAEYKDQIVAGTLYLYDDVDVFSYLGGADHEFQQIRPSNAVIYETICWAKRQGKKRLILGGGNYPNDGIVRFKSSFSPLRAKFHIYKHIHLLDAYIALSHAWSAHYQCDAETSGYFPVYRSIPVD